MKGQGQTGDQKYLKLFDAIARQKEYDEIKLAKKFGYTNNMNGLSVAKNYLFNMILRCLRFSGKSSRLYAREYTPTGTAPQNRAISNTSSRVVA